VVSALLGIAAAIAILPFARVDVETADAIRLGNAYVMPNGHCHHAQAANQAGVA